MDLANDRSAYDRSSAKYHREEVLQRAPRRQTVTLRGRVGCSDPTISIRGNACVMVLADVVQGKWGNEQFLESLNGCTQIASVAVA